MTSNIETLLIRYFSDDLDEQCVREVDVWIGESESNKKEFERHKKLWQEVEKPVYYSDKQIEKALKKTKKQIPSFKRQRMIFYVKQIAAVLVMSLLLSSVADYFIFRSGNVIKGQVSQLVVAPKGMATSLKLADGTVVHLFPGSKLTYPVIFAGGSREVELLGEGFFEVVHNDEMPFVVKTKYLSIKDLGTEFNVRAYEDEDFVETILVNGKVVLERLVDGKVIPIKTLLPNQRSVYNCCEKKLEVFNETSVEKYVGWAEGKLVFDNDPFSDVLSKISKWYNVDFEVKNKKLKKYRFTGTFKDEPLEEVLALMQYSSPFRYKIKKISAGQNDLDAKKIILIN